MPVRMDSVSSVRSAVSRSCVRRCALVRVLGREELGVRCHKLSTSVGRAGWGTEMVVRAPSLLATGGVAREAIVVREPRETSVGRAFELHTWCVTCGVCARSRLAA